MAAFSPWKNLFEFIFLFCRRSVPTVVFARCGSVALAWVVRAGSILGMISAAPPTMNQESSSNQVFEVVTPGRLHFGMLSFGQPFGRSFGGLGAMIAGCGVRVRMRRASQYSAVSHVGERAIGVARRCAAAWGLDEHSCCAIETLEIPRQHIGLGTGTQLELAVAAGMQRLYVEGPNGSEQTYSAKDAAALAQAAGRGLRSSVGVYGFGTGGMILEAGKLQGEVIAPLVSRVALPEAWRVVVFIQREAEGLHGDAERTAFAGLEMVPLDLTAELTRLAVMEILPAALAARFTDFAAALTAYGKLAGKPFERASARLPYAATTADLFEWLDQQGIQGYAQSSWGPAVVAVCESALAANAVVTAAEAAGLSTRHELIVAEFDNRGSVLREVSDESLSA
jgi:beta-ribofuranosylaminobenzene 5'-phosphate synthase